MADTFAQPIDVVEFSGVGNPPSGYQRLMPKPDGKLYVKRSNGTEYAIGPQQIYIGTAPTTTTDVPLLVFEQVTIAGQSTYRMKVENGAP